MPKRSAAKTEMFDHTSDLVHAECGHPYAKHTGGVNMICPPTPPAKQVTVDEAVMAKGGKPSTEFERSLAAATGEDERKAKLALAEEHFDRRTNEPTHASLPLKQLRPMAGNPRGEVGDVTELVKSMETNGFIGSLFVREVEENVFEVWAGNRRLKAAQHAGLEEVPCDIYDITEVQALELNLTEQINRADLSPLQEATHLQRLMELAGYSVDQAADKMGKSGSWVTKRVALCGLAPELKKGLAKGEVSLTVANALAALPTQQMQVKTFDALPGGMTAEAQVQFVRVRHCRPLSDATWKLTDAELLPEAGACSACPFNSHNNAMPGLFDNAKAKPTCAKTECFDDKANAAWLLKTAKAKAAGAKVLALSEGRKLFHGAGGPLPGASRYVEAGEVAKKDKKGRTWLELVADLPEEHRPQLHVAQDGAGKLRELLVLDKVLEGAATHLKLKWAANVVAEATERKSPERKAKEDAEFAEKRIADKVRDEVFTAVINSVAADVARGTGTLPAMRLLAARIGQRGVERLNSALGVTKRPKDWLEKGATESELLALVWLDDASDELRSYDEFDERFVKLAVAHGFKLADMVKAQLATAKAEAAK